MIYTVNLGTNIEFPKLKIIKYRLQSLTSGKPVVLWSNNLSEFFPMHSKHFSFRFAVSVNDWFDRPFNIVVGNRMANNRCVVPRLPEICLW